MNSLLISILTLGFALYQPSTLQLLEEQVEAVLMVQCVEYEKGIKGGGQLADINVVYTGNNTVDAKKDSGFYYVYGNYNFDKYTYINTDYFGNIPSKSFNKSSSRTYLAKVKEVLDEFRVQEIIIINDPESFDFSSFNYSELVERSDLFYPKVVRRNKSQKKEPDSEKKQNNKKKKVKKKDKDE